VHVHWAAIVTAASAVLIAVVGWLVSLSFRTHTRAHLFEKRLDAYAALWQQLGELPVKAAKSDHDPAEDDCVRIAGTLTAWYYADGGGMFVTDPTRKLWQAVRENLLAGGGGRVTLSRQASLLRTQLKADLEVYYGRHLSGDRLRSEAEKDFLQSTVLESALFDALPARTRKWMWFRYHILRRDEPVMRTRALWRRVIASGIQTDASATT
jgi:hypothetical protein